MNEMTETNQINELKVTDELNISLVEEKLDLSNYEKIPISAIGEIGAVGTPIIEALGAISGVGGSGLYMVNTAGRILFKCAAKGGYIGGMTTATGKIGQATLTPVIFNPVTLCSTLTMVSMMIKLDEISQNVKEILRYIELEDKAVIKGALKRLIDIMDEYKKNANNKDVLRITMQEIRIRHLNDMIQMQEKYKLRIEELIGDNKSNKSHYDKIRKSFYYYMWATYLMCLCRFMLIGYEEKYDSEHLMKEKEKIMKYSDEVKDTFKECYEYIENHYDKGFIEKAKQVGEFFATAFSEVPMLNNSIITYAIASLSKKPIHDSRIKGKEEEVRKIEETHKPELEILINKIDLINKFYNEPFNMIVDKDNVYIEKVEIN